MYGTQRTLYTLLFLLLLPIAVIADSFSNERMRNLSKEDGLPGETVSQIITGPDGQTWMATNDGVCRYNGREISSFTMPRKGREPNYTFCLSFASDNTLYAGTREGLFKLQRGKDTFTHIYPSISKAEAVLAVGDNVFVGNRQGFNILKDGKIKTITVGATPTGIENGVRDIRIGEDKAVWFISRYGLHRYDNSTGKVKSYDIAHLLPERAALAFFLPIAGHFFIGTKNNGLYLYSIRTNSVKRIPEIGNSIGSIRRAPGGKVTVSGGGAFLLDGKTGKVLQKFTIRDRQGKGELPTDAVYCYYRDNNGVDWFGFYRYGMSYIYHSENLFKIYTYGNFSSEGLDVRGIFVNGKQKVLGTADDLWLIDEGRNIVRSYTSEQLGNAHAISTIAYFNGCYYVGNFDAGIRRFSASTFEMLPNPPEPLLSTVTVGDLKADGKGNLWIGTSEGLFILDSHDHLRHFTENNSSIIGGQISAICFMPGGSAWLGGPNGLCIYNPKTNTFEKDHFPNGFFASSRISNVCNGHGGLFFFTSTSDVYYSDRAMRNFGELPAAHDINVTNYVSFLDDFRGHYWEATSDGLFCSDYNQANILHFGYGEGLRCQLIGGRMTVDKGGTIWIGTSNGLMYVRVADLLRWQKLARYKMLVYHISVDGNPVSMDIEDDANDYHRLNLKWNITSSVMTLRPLLADFARPYGRLYEYRIDGRGEWLFVRDGSDLRLHSLSLGTHHLELRLAGAPGTITKYTINVSPSGWAILELLLLIAAITALILWFRYHKNASRLLEERNDIEDALVEAETENAETVKYDRVHIDEEESKAIVDKLRKYIEKEKVYLNPDLKMSDLADYLHLSPSKLSQVFSLYLKENWYDFINSYRLAEFKRLIDEGAYRQYTLLALSAKCGFKKSSFFSTFRKVEGMTPTEYLKKVKK